LNKIKEDAIISKVNDPRTLPIVIGRLKGAIGKHALRDQQSKT
jgi:hypothetical protein